MKFNLLPFFRYLLLVTVLNVAMDYADVSQGWQIGMILAVAFTYPERIFTYPLAEQDDDKKAKDDTKV